MIDFPLLAHLLMWALVALIFIFKVFKWGYDKEERGERTDILGRKNNHMPKK